MRSQAHRTDLCIVGGGMAGLIAALAAARRGARVVLVHDRPVLGGNASSEVRMEISGAHGPNRRETGILEELILENFHRNPEPSWSIWDSVLYGAAQYQPGITLLLNCSMNEAAMEWKRIRSVRGWQTTTETWHTVEAGLFADCSGDAILAPLSGAEFRIGREARAEFGEPIAPEVADAKTMGMTCLLQARETGQPQPFTPPSWANVYQTDADLHGRDHDVAGTNWWWMEVGGEGDVLHDAEKNREELLRIAFGIWDHVKNRGDHGAANWVLDWVGFLPGKRESRRYVGDHVLTQHDVEAEGRFPDLIAYGGWTMDDHFPAGFHHPGEGTIFHPAPSPFGIPYRSLYSRNIGNLFCAGRNISATHAAMSATRVMGTTSLMGQAVGTAAAIAVRDGLDPRGVHANRLAELQAALMEDDCWLPWRLREIPALTRTATLKASEGDAEPLRDGLDRPDEAGDHGWSCAPGGWVELAFPRPAAVREARLVFDSDLNRNRRRRGANMPAFRRHTDEPLGPPETLVKSFHIECRDTAGAVRTFPAPESYQRLVRVPLGITASSVRLVLDTTWGAERAHLFAFEVR
ncbi:MAG: FAD-dependent oxidoreductase [Candidatus Coatesbacteria bacterium]